MDRELERMREAIEARMASVGRSERLGRVLKRVVRCVSDVRQYLEMADGESTSDREVLSTVRTTLVDLLESEGVELFGAPGEQAHAGRHEIVSVVDSDDLPTGTVTSVVLEGALWESELLQKASVVVSRHQAARNQEQ